MCTPACTKACHDASIGTGLGGPPSPGSRCGDRCFAPPQLPTIVCQHEAVAVVRSPKGSQLGLPCHTHVQSSSYPTFQKTLQHALQLSIFPIEASSGCLAIRSCLVAKPANPWHAWILSCTNLVRRCGLSVVQLLSHSKRLNVIPEAGRSW